MTDAKRIPISVVLEVRDGCLCFAAQKAARLLARRFDKVFAALGITNGQFSMMVALGGMGQPRLGALAEFLAMDQTTLTAAVKALEARGLLTRKVDKDDLRARRVELTPEGTEVVEKAVPLWRAEIAGIRESMGPGRAGELMSLLHLPGLTRRL